MLPMGKRSSMFCTPYICNCSSSINCNWSSSSPFALTEQKLGWIIRFLGLFPKLLWLLLVSWISFCFYSEIADTSLIDCCKRETPILYSWIWTMARVVCAGRNSSDSSILWFLFIMFLESAPFWRERVLKRFNVDPFCVQEFVVFLQFFFLVAD